MSKQLVPWHVLFTIRQVLAHGRRSQQRGKDFISPSDDKRAVYQPCGRVKDGVFDYQPLGVYSDVVPICIENGSCHVYICGTSGWHHGSLRREIIKKSLWRRPPSPLLPKQSWRLTQTEAAQWLFGYESSQYFHWLPRGSGPWMKLGRWWHKNPPLLMSHHPKWSHRGSRDRSASLCWGWAASPGPGRSQVHFMGWKTSIVLPFRI